VHENLIHMKIQNKISESELSDDYDTEDLFLTIKDFLCDILFMSNDYYVKCSSTMRNMRTYYI